MEQFIRIDDLCSHLKVCKSTVYKMIQTGKLPQPIRITDSIQAWPESAIDAWIEERKKEPVPKTKRGRPPKVI
jgi:predicted DNA-binding transcriptional regulator AlpA